MFIIQGSSVKRRDGSPERVVGKPYTAVYASRRPSPSAVGAPPARVTRVAFVLFTL